MLYGTPRATSALRCVRCKQSIGSPCSSCCTLSAKRRWQGGSLLAWALPGAHALTTSRRLIGLRLSSSTTHVIWSLCAARGGSPVSDSRWTGKWRQKLPYALGTLPPSSAHGSQNLQPCFLRRPICVSPLKNHRFSTTIFFHEISFVVSSGNPWRRSIS